MSYEGSAVGAMREIEIDVGSGIKNKDVVVLTVFDTEIESTSKIVAVQSGTAATGKTADENEMDLFVVNARPTAAGGSMVLNIKPLHQVVLSGKYKISYMLG